MVKVKTVEVKPVQKVTTIQRPIQKVTTIQRPVQKVTTHNIISRPITTKTKTKVTTMKMKEKKTGPPWCEWRGEKESGRWVCDVDWPQMSWYEDVLEELDGLFPGEGGPPEWNERDCDALPVEQMMRCATMHREYVDIEGR